jgi:hypothetical protein
VDVHVNRRPQLADSDDVVEVDRARRLKSGHRAPPVFSRLGGFPVMIFTAKLDRIGFDVGSFAKRFGLRQPAGIFWLPGSDRS